MSGGAANVYLVDDDAGVLKSLARLLRAAGLNAVPHVSPREFLERYDSSRPGCLVLDVAMPDLNGLDLQAELAARGSEIPIVFLSGRANVPMSVRGMKQGASDFLTKPVNEAELLSAVHAALERDRLARMERAEVDEIRRRAATLTPREREVMEHVISGQLNKQTASDLGTAVTTIKVHRARMMEKMKVESVAELVRMAARAKIWPAAPVSRA